MSSHITKALKRLSIKLVNQVQQIKLIKVENYQKTYVMIKSSPLKHLHISFDEQDCILASYMDSDGSSHFYLVALYDDIDLSQHWPK